MLDRKLLFQVVFVKRILTMDFLPAIRVFLKAAAGMRTADAYVHATGEKV